jgi:hypothetical protein
MISRHQVFFGLYCWKTHLATIKHFFVFIAGKRLATIKRFLVCFVKECLVDAKHLLVYIVEKRIVAILAGKTPNSLAYIAKKTPNGH